MSAFKSFLDAVASGEPRHDLFLFKDRVAREQAVVELFNEAGERGLCPIVRSAPVRVIVNTSVATIRIAHQFSDQELAGVVWSAVHGLDTLDEFPDVAENLRAMIR